MNTIDSIKKGIHTLYKTNPNIHVNVSISNKKVNLRNKAAVIKGVYPHVFRIQNSSDSRECYTLQYIDVLTGTIDILELPR